MPTEDISSVWKGRLFTLVATLLVFITAYWDTVKEIVNTWGRSDTFTHGYLIIPIVAWLIWEKRFELVQRRPTGTLWVIPVLLLLGLMWLLGYYSGIWVIQQFAVVSMIPVIVLGIMGWDVVRTILFPLCFLGFMVPLGEELVPILINFTADFTTAMIRLTGIPIYREGTYFELPSGDWSVVKACSGVRYLISSVVLGLLYAYLSYRSLKKQLVFVLIAIIVPIFANGLRAFMIVMIGHFSNMALATGIDHLVYGWLFFGLVIAIMCYIGSFWYDEPEAIQSITKTSKALPNQSSNELPKLALGSVLVISVLLVGPLKAQFSTTGSQMIQNDMVLAPSGSAGWIHEQRPLTQWQPVYQGLDTELQTSYASNSQRVALYIGTYFTQRQGAELINSQNRLVAEDDSPWRLLKSEALLLDLLGQTLQLPAIILTSEGQKLLAVYVYYIGGELTSNPYQAKWLQVKSKLFAGSQQAAIISFASPLGDDEHKVRNTLQQFSQQMMPSILNALDPTATQL